MNEHIVQCAQEAGLQPFEDCGPGYVAKMEKFAELIIKECIDSVKEDIHTGQSQSDFSTGYDAALEMAVCNIKEKFGVN